MAAAQRRLRRSVTLLAALVLWTCVWGAVAPSSGGANGTEVERRWEMLFARSYLGLAGGRAQPSWQNDYLRGIKRVRRLYCNVGIGFHLQVLPDGRIAGSHLEDPHSLLEISSVERGVVSLFGVKSEMFVAMNRRGRLYAARLFGDECKFRETLLANNYNAYESFVYKGFYVALNRQGRPRRGDRATTSATGTHFLPRL
ncbi:fibroblast growth factor 6 [Syngnathus scovelli]|uniref:fibroblast growth factor 6 n=1 Tax=Syngnathus scovelli TaxID=161590 RepID=UPI00210FB885|nr:fibroblast growth factor 6 [Syngnathus scovelli]XP_049616870.1 fibroblast growth factor 6 [Syngnathus scovelli]